MPHVIAPSPLLADCFSHAQLCAKLLSRRLIDHRPTFATPACTEAFAALQRVFNGTNAWCRYSIHVADKDRETQQEAEASFPRNVDGLDNVFHCGFHSELSFGCASYLVTRPEGNVLVDVPRYVPKLLKRIQVCCTNTHRSLQQGFCHANQYGLLEWSDFAGCGSRPMRNNIHVGDIQPGS